MDVVFVQYSSPSTYPLSYPVTYTSQDTFLDFEIMANDDFDTATEQFHSWLSQVGIVISPSMAIADFRSAGRGRGGVAVAAMTTDEVVFSIPRSAVLNVATATPFLGTSIQEAITKMPPWLALTTIMLAQGSQSKSKWTPYFSMLPRELDSLVFWSDSELAELQGSTVVQKIGRVNAEKLFTKHIYPLGLANTSLEMCHRVSSTIQAYAFDIPEKARGEDVDDHVVDDGDDLVSDDGEDEKTVLSMIPLADILNADADKNNVRLCCDNENLEMRTIKPIAKGEEIFNDYGELPRADLLRRYGYVTNNYMAYDVAEVMTESVFSIFRNNDKISELCQEPMKPLDAEELAMRIALAEREGILEGSYDLALPESETPSISDELLALVYILLLDDEHLNAIRESKSALPSRSKLATEMVGRVLAEVFRLRENEYSTSIETDDHLLQAGNLPRRTLMAIQVRLGREICAKKSYHNCKGFYWKRPKNEAHARPSSTTEEEIGRCRRKQKKGPARVNKSHWKLYCLE